MAEQSKVKINIKTQQTLTISVPSHKHGVRTRHLTFNFDHIFDDTSNQEQVFDKIAASTVDDVLNGYNGTIFAYGQTGSGKTHSMFAPTFGQKQSGDNALDNFGVVPRAVRRIFARAADEQRTAMIVVKASLFEIYMEGVYDLLVPCEERKRLPIKESPQLGVHVPGLTQHPVVSVADMDRIVAAGSAHRRVAETLLNAHSSRSHLVLALSVERRVLADDSVRLARLNLVDLAGSERVLKSGAQGQVGWG